MATSKRSWSAALLTGLVYAAAAGSADSAAPGDPARGLTLAKRFCGSCHLVLPDDKGPVPAGVPPFSEIAAKPGIDAERIVALALGKPHPQMPEPPLSEQQLRDVAALIMSLR